MKKNLLAIAIALPLSLFAADMDANGIVTKQSSVDVKTTINRIEMMVKKKGLTFFNRINHKENAKKANGPDLNDAELIIFGNPKAGLKLMTKDPKAGLDLPLKMLAYKENAKKANGPDLNDAELIIFGNPKAGLKLMTKDPKAGLDLPLKMLAYKAKDGNVYLSYRDVKFYEKIYNLEDCKVQNKMSKMLDIFSERATLSPEAFGVLSQKNKEAAKAVKAEH